MSITYDLFKNNLVTDKEEFAARVFHQGTSDIELIVSQMLIQGSTVTRTDIIAVIEDMFKAIEHMLLEGKRINLGDMVHFIPV
jgi:nucleoid DNA-binding protein